MSGRTPSIGDYALIGDCHGAALVSGTGSIDWCCLPRFDSSSCFGALLDPAHGGSCSVSVAGDAAWRGSSYIEDTLVLQTLVESAQATLRVTDFFAMREHGALSPRRELIRIVTCERGHAEVRVEVAPRFDYGRTRPWLRRSDTDTITATGGDNGLLIFSDGQPQIEQQAVQARKLLHAGERLRLLVRSVQPHLLEREPSDLDAEAIDRRLEETIAWWRKWRTHVNVTGAEQRAIVRSAITLKALTYAPTGAIVAAPTTSLPERLGGTRNWDYRYSWVRDSALTADTLAEIGCEYEARQFRHFIVRSAGGHAEDLQIVYGIGGERRLPELELDLPGYRDSRPVRIGNGAVDQVQLDAFGEILDLDWRWQLRGHSPDDDEWQFFAELIEQVIERWTEPDHGIWEWRGEPRHFVHSKACCWEAVDRGLRLAEASGRRSPVRRWRRASRQIREAIEARGYDAQRGVFVQCFDEPGLDAALLLLPATGVVSFDDERMLRTTDAIREELDANGLLYRYRMADDLPEGEGAFLACSFWLATCYARQQRLAQAREVFDRAAATASSVGLFSEEVDPSSGELLGNYPQTLAHLAHAEAARALAAAGASAPLATATVDPPSTRSGSST